MPPATFLMILLPSVHTLSFLLIGLGVMGLAFLSYICQKRIQKKLGWSDSSLVFCMGIFKCFFGFLKLFFQREVFQHADEKGRDRA